MRLTFFNQMHYLTQCLSLRKMKCTNQIELILLLFTVLFKTYYILRSTSCSMLHEMVLQCHFLSDSETAARLLNDSELLVANQQYMYFASLLSSPCKDLKSEVSILIFHLQIFIISILQIHHSIQERYEADNEISWCYRAICENYQTSHDELTQAIYILQDLKVFFSINFSITMDSYINEASHCYRCL